LPGFSAEPLGGSASRRWTTRYPAQPATTAYRLIPDDGSKMRWSLATAAEASDAADIATLCESADVDVKVDGHSIVTRHWRFCHDRGRWTSRRIIYSYAKNYPIAVLILAITPVSLKCRSWRSWHAAAYAQFPIFEQEAIRSLRWWNHCGSWRRRIESASMELSPGQKLFISPIRRIRPSDKMAL